MKLRAQQIAELLKGVVIGDPTVTVSDVSKIENGKEGTLSFLANPKYENHIYTTNASVVLVNEDIELKKEVSTTLIKVKDAYKSLAALLDLYVQSLPQKSGIEDPVFIAGNTNIGKGGYIGAFAYIGDNCKIGNNVKIHPHTWVGENTTIDDNTTLFAGVKAYPGTVIGKNCIIHAGAVLGSDGFGFAPQDDGSYKKLHQIGNVILEDNVEIGANTTIDCATMGSTIIKEGVKLDNLIQIAHNVEIGENTVIAAQTGIAGSTSVGKNCVFAGQTGFVGHIKIGNNVTVASKSGVSNSVEDGKTIMGPYAFDASLYRRAYAVFRNLPKLFMDVNNMKKEIDKVKNK